MVGWTKRFSIFYSVKVSSGYIQTFHSCWNHYSLDLFHKKVLLYWIHLHWWIMTRDVSSPLWVVAPKCLVGGWSWHLHKMGFRWVSAFQYGKYFPVNRSKVTSKYIYIYINTPYGTHDILIYLFFNKNLPWIRAPFV